MLIDAHPGRQAADEITLFESMGLAVEDVAAGYVVYRNALESGAGMPVAIGGLRHA